MDAIILQNVSKKYSLSQYRPILLKSLFVPQEKEEVWALKNVNLNIKKGETVGIIGENGSGKSTLLKIIAGITTPTKGSVKVNGRVGSLIELGAGFHQDLTGRENIYLNGTLLGLTKKEIDKKYKDIVDFADIGEFINQPIRTYSSGMTIRLGFSVAVHLDPDILLIDEVLAVGDEEFQRKCIYKISEFQKLKKTFILVSHNITLIENLCKTAIWLEKGKILKRGDSVKVTKRYLNSFRVEKKILYKNPENKIIINSKQPKTGVKFKEIRYIADNANSTFLSPNNHLKIMIEYENYSQIKSALFGVAVYDELGLHLYGVSSPKVDLSDGVGCVYLVMDKNPISNGKLLFTFGISSLDGHIQYDWLEKEYTLSFKDKINNNFLNFNFKWVLK